MAFQVLDLDGSVAGQGELGRRPEGAAVELRGWGRLLRMGCTWRRFRAFEDALVLPRRHDDEPLVTFLGSSHFHHLTLALLRRLDVPFNLAVIDSAIDWGGHAPFLSHRNWLRHVGAHTQVRRIFHLGSSVFGKLAAGADPRFTIFPINRHDQATAPLRTNLYRRCDVGHVEELLAAHAAELRRWPLYVSIDKAALVLRDAESNGEAGHLWREEMFDLVQTLQRLGGPLVGVDVVGDWSPPTCGTALNRFLAWSQRPRWHVDPGHAQAVNQRTNLHLLTRLLGTAAALPRAA